MSTTRESRKLRNPFLKSIKKYRFGLECMAWDILTFVVIALGVSFVFSEVCYRLRYPRVIGQIVAGIFLGLPFFHKFYGNDIITDVGFLSDLGIIFLLLITGMQLNLHKFRKAEKDTVIIALFSVIIPFLLGYIFMQATGYGKLESLIVGAALSLTAEGTKLKVLFEMRALNTKIGVILLGAGILDDIFEVIFLSLILTLAHGASLALTLLPVKFILFIAITYATYKILPPIYSMVQKEHSRIATFSFILFFGLVIAALSRKLELGPVLGAFIAGVIIHLTDHHRYEYEENVRELEAMTFAFIIPFFFINIGLNFEFMTLFNNFYFVVMILIVATVGKLLGALLATPFTDLTLGQTHLIGWGMNSRGAIELIIAEIARQNGLISNEVYSAIVFMAVITTLMFPLMLKWIVSQDRSILN